MSDLRHDDLQTSRDGVTWSGWLTATTATEAIFPGAAGQAYYFRVRATDQVGNVGPWVVVGPVVVDAVTKYYHHGEGRVAMRQGGEVYYLYGDRLGSTSLTTDETGTVVAEARYLPFGQERWSGGAAVTDFGFTGQRNEAGFGLLDYHARFYDPGVGRFVAADAVVADYANSQALNRYAYVYNNPLRFIDPSGHATECGATARGDCEGGGTRVPGPTRDEWTEVDRYAAGITYQDYVAGKAYYFDYASDPQLQLEDLKRINGFGAGSRDGAWHRRTYAKLYAEYALQQKLDIGTDFEVARAALAEARTSDDAAYFLWGLITFGAAIGGINSGDDSIPPYDRSAYGNWKWGVRNRVIRRDRGICQYCGKRPTRSNPLEVDHIVSVKEHWETGGWQLTDKQRNDWFNDMNNLITACRICNRKKADTPYRGRNKPF